MAQKITNKNKTTSISKKTSRKNPQESFGMQSEDISIIHNVLTTIGIEIDEDELKEQG
jgi:hypothetical protein